MMNINLDLKVATIDFIRCIDGKEIILDTIMENEHVYLLIYPKTPVYVHAIDDIFDNCQYDVIGIADVEVGFDEKNPFKYSVGMHIGDSAPFVSNDDVFFDLINQALKYNGAIDEFNEDTIVFDRNCYLGIRNTNAIIDVVGGDCLSDIQYDVEIFDDDDDANMFLDWINKDYPLVIDKLDKNKDIWQDVLDDLKSKKAILNPKSAFELAQVKLEYDETKRSLNQHKDKITIPRDDLHKLNQLLNGGIVMINEIINVDFNNGGNLGIFIESMAKEIPIDAEMVNVGDDMIEIDFNQYK